MGTLAGGRPKSLSRQDQAAISRQAVIEHQEYGGGKHWFEHYGDEGDSSGYAQVEERPDHVWVSRVQVDPPMRGQGVGSALLDHVQRHFAPKPLRLKPYPIGEHEGDPDEDGLRQWYGHRGFHDYQVRPGDDLEASDWMERHGAAETPHQAAIGPLAQTEPTLPETLYHVSPAKNRDSIKGRGLELRGKPGIREPLVHASESPLAAGLQDDVWEISTQHGSWRKTPRSNEWVSDQPVPSAGVRRREAARWAPSSGVFGPTTGFDPRLFSEDHELHPGVRGAIMERLDQALRVDSGLAGSDWQGWVKVYIAGGSASEWAGGRPNDTAQDLDVLLGISYHQARLGSGSFQGLDSSQIDAAVNAALRAHFNDPAWQPPFGGAWSLTGYVNHGAWDIKEIKPYAAYNVSDMTWAVKPPHLPGHSVSDFHPALIQQARALAMEARAILRMDEPARSHEARALWERIHSDRSRAFSAEGEGWQDPGNIIEKWLAYAPGNILGKIRDLALAQREHHTAVLPGGDLSHLDQPAEWVRTESLMPHREWHHGPGWSRDPQDPAARYAPRHTPQSWAENARSVAQEGIHQPIHLTWNPKTNEAKVTEGNSRLMWAAEAGHEAVPVTGHRSHSVEGHPLPGPSRSAEFPGHIPGDLRPSSFLPGHYMYQQEAPPAPNQKTAAADPFDEETGEARPWHERWPGESGAEASSRKERYVRQVAERHGVGLGPALQAISRVAQDARTGQPFANAHDYGFANDPGHQGDRFFTEKMIGTLNRPETWRDKPTEHVPVSEIHSSQNWLHPRLVAHNLFHPGRPSPVSEDEGGHPDIHPEDTDYGWASDDERAERDLGKTTRFVRRRDGRIQVGDGHHRVAADMLLGKKTTPGMVIGEDELRGLSAPGHVDVPQTAHGLWEHLRNHHDRTPSELPGDDDENYWPLHDEHQHGHEYEQEYLGHEHPHQAAAKPVQKTAGPREEQLAAMAPHDRATALAQEQTRYWNPRLMMGLGDHPSGRSHPTLTRWLRSAGHPGAEDAYVARHPRPEQGTSNTARGPDGEPAVVLHPDRWDYGTLAHETAHLIRDHETGRAPGQPAADPEGVHSPQWAAHYSRLLDDLEPGAGSDFLGKRGEHLSITREAAGGLYQPGDHPGPFWHGSMNRIEPGSHIDHDAPPEGHGRLDHSFFTTSREVAEDAADPRDGRGHGWVHQVEPTGPYLVDHGEPESWKSASPLRVISSEPGQFGPRHPHPGRWSQHEAAGSGRDAPFICSRGHEHQGKRASGLLIRSKGEDGLWRYLLQKRAGGPADHGGKWSIPCGAIGDDEDSFEGAGREYREEMGPLPRDCTLHHSVTSTDCGDWQFDTHVMDAPECFMPRGGGETEYEVSGAAWHTAAEIERLRKAGELHPGFAESWDTVRRSRGPKTATAEYVARATETKAAAVYQPATGEAKRCGNCAMFRHGRNHGWCTKVRGAIEEDYVCRFFSAREDPTEPPVSLDLRSEGATKMGVTGPDVSPRSAFIYLDVPNGVIHQVPGGEDESHITIVYLGKNVSDEVFSKACRRTQEAAARSPELEGVLRGIETFPASDGKVPAFVPAYIPGIGALRRDLADLSGSEHSDFRPHLTLAYLEEGDSLPPPHPPVHVRFPELCVQRGDDLRRYPLGRLRAEARDREPSVPPGRAHRIISLTRRNGGHSMSLTSGRSPSSGYMVAQKHGSHVLPAGDFFGRDGHQILSSYVHAHKEAFGRRGAHLGAWHDQESGNVFLDISHNVRDEGEAKTMARQHDQIAIWDLKGKQEIATGGTGGLEKQAAAGTCEACGLATTPVSATLEFFRRGGQDRLRTSK